uniref:Ig-like domain-containing protein n=1 Tax=Oreochromis niloticus TaxID=8128 RepID=A0A669F8M4_ORENI
MIIVVTIFCFLRASDTKSVNQTPPSIITRIGESVQSEIKCSHSIKDYEVILWYKQDQHQTLEILGYVNLQFVNKESNPSGNISFDGDGRKKSALTIYNLKFNDSAVYFCAAKRHSAAVHCKVSTKTFSLICLTEQQSTGAPEHLQLASLSSLSLLNSCSIRAGR